MKLFRRGNELTLNRVHDVITIREGDERLKLTVNGDAMRIVAGLNRAQAKMKELDETSPDEAVIEAAEYFATVLFGKEQAGQLMAFYANDPGCVITVCGKYFRERLAEKITKAQKKLKDAETV
jgi:hypothetical protein